MSEADDAIEAVDDPTVMPWGNVPKVRPENAAPMARGDAFVWVSTDSLPEATRGALAAASARGSHFSTVVAAPPSSGPRGKSVPGNWVTLRVRAADPSGTVIGAENTLQVAAAGHVWSARLEERKSSRGSLRHSIVFHREDGQDKRTPVEAMEEPGNQVADGAFEFAAITRTVGPYVFLREYSSADPFRQAGNSTPSVRASIKDLRTGETLSLADLFREGDGHLDEFGLGTNGHTSLAELLEQKGRAHGLLSDYRGYLADDAPDCVEHPDDVTPSSELVTSYGPTGGLFLGVRFLPGRCTAPWTDGVRWGTLFPSRRVPLKSTPQALRPWAKMPVGVRALMEKLPAEAVGGFSVLEP